MRAILPAGRRPHAVAVVTRGATLGRVTDSSLPAPARSRSLVVKTTSGLDRPESANQAFTVAAAAVAAGVEVSVWLTGEAAWFGVPGRAAELELEHAARLPDLLDAVLAAGTLTVCTQCAARRGITADDVLPGVRIAGAAVFVEEALREGAQALVY
ncbi:sulfur reduction protein DsrE [Cellulosimicrobium sp. TH-20]|nr:sulfur reduction protein DsrE [Cellulosimicrobium sp. TH-20]